MRQSSVEMLSLGGSMKRFRLSWAISIGLHVILFTLLIFHPDFFSHQLHVIDRGKEVDQQVIQAVMVPEKSNEKPMVASAAPLKARAVVTPLASTPSRHPAILKKQLLADLKNDLAKHKSTALALQKVIRTRALQKQLLAEKMRVEGVRSSRTRGEVDKYRALILQVISQNWRVPGVPNKNSYAELMIRLAPGGDVLDVQITRSSGSAGLDSSARSAVFRSSPLPVPSDPGDFEPFRSFMLKVKPQNILPA